MRAAFHTLGCKVNQYETEAMKEQFISCGFVIVGEEEEADCYVINTCTVTNLADRKSRQYIRRMKRVSPDAVVAVTGCYSQVKPEELEAMPEVDIVTGNGEKDKLAGLVLERLKARSEGNCGEKTVRVIPYDELTDYNETGIIMSMEGRTRAYIKIQEGCDRFCSYCLIPFARGHVRSRDPNEVKREAQALIDAGFREIVLTGINTALYGTEEGFKEHFKTEGRAVSDGIELIIGMINEIPGDFRIRLSSLEPTVVNAEYVKRLEKYEKLCHHLHLSAQSGSDSVINAMNRHYTRDEYLAIVNALRSFDRGYGITTDIIVGFPGETENDFEDSLDIIREACFAKVHGFKYSKREGTRAEKMKNQISPQKKNERIARLEAVSGDVSKDFRKTLSGTVRRVLFEEISAAGSKDFRTVSGYTDNYIKVYCKVRTDEASGLLNTLRDVKLSEVYLDGMTGEIPELSE